MKSAKLIDVTKSTAKCAVATMTVTLVAHICYASQQPPPQHESLQCQGWARRAHGHRGNHTCLSNTPDTIGAVVPALPVHTTVGAFVAFIGIILLPKLARQGTTPAIT